MRAVSPPLCLMLLLAAAGGVAVPAADTKPAETTADVAARALLDKLEERQMADVSLMVIARLEADPDASPDLKREVAFRRAAALIGVSRMEADGAKRAKILDEAQASLDGFLASGSATDRQAIAAYTQKGNLLVERGRAKADQANRPGADAATLRAEAAKFFDEAVKSLKGTSKADEPIVEVTNAEAAVLKVLREVDGTINGLKADGQKQLQAAQEAAANDKTAPKTKTPPVAPAPMKETSGLTADQQRELEALEEDREALRAKLIQTRLSAAVALFEKAKVYPEKSAEWTDGITKSAELFQEIADKYPSKAFGFLARYYEGRNYAMLGRWDDTVNTLAPLVKLEQKMPVAISLRSKSMNTTLEALLALNQKYEAFDASARKFALEDVTRLPGAKLDADWLGLKYRAAKVLMAQAEALSPKDDKGRNEQRRMLADAKKLAVEVAKANATFAAEARELAAKLGQTVAEGEKTFESVMDEARVLLATMQGKAAEAKAAAEAKDDAAEAAARKEQAAARDQAVVKFEEALKLAGISAPLAADPAEDGKLAKDVTIDDVNQGRYLLTYLLFDGERLPEAAAMGRMLAERYPNAKGSRQAAKIAMAAWQQAGQKSEGEARKEAYAKAVELAAVVMKTWPEESESGDAALIAIGAAMSARDPKAMASIIAQVPAKSSKRAEVLLRAGAALWREVQESRRSEGELRPDEATLKSWKATATTAIDEGLGGLGDAQTLPPAPLGTLAVAAALSRVQIAMEDNDDGRARSVLEHPGYGPWTLSAGDKPVLEGKLTEAALTLALRLFIQSEDFDRAQEAMGGLEKAAGSGDEASTKLTAMYLSMGRDLQTQLETLCSGEGANTPEVRERAAKILGGFEKFLDGIAARDPKTSSQFWVASTYLSLGSGKGTGAIVPRAKATAYLQKAADVYQKLLANKAAPDLNQREPSIRLRMAAIYKELGDWDNAQQQIDWILSDAKRQNSLEAQIAAAEILEAAGRAAAEAGNADKADGLLRDAAGGRRGSPAVIWGWSNIANKLGRQGFGGGEKAQQNRETFFNARLRVAECLLARARLPGKKKEREKRLETAEAAITVTRQLYPDMGGEAFAQRFERLLKEVQQERGHEPLGFKDLAAPAGGEKQPPPDTAGGNP